jgi:cytochrome c5
LSIAVLAALASFAAAGAAGESSGKEVVAKTCARCHENPASPAPKVGDREAWIPRMSKGIDALVMSAIRGHGGMPPRGTRADLTDNEIREAILYMFNPGATQVVPAKAAAPLPAGVQSATVNGLRIHLGLTSAEKMRQYPAGSPEAKLHGGVPAGDGYQHVNVSLFDASTDAPIAGARVSVAVEEIGMQTVTMALEPNALAGNPSYGGYVRMLPKGKYVLRVRVTKPGAGIPVEATFTPPPG